jgi:hypothetical protein
MPFDNFTLHKYRVLKETPKGDPPGAIITETEDVGNIFLSIGIVERLPDEEPAKGTYKRRDLRAEA